MNLPDFFSKTWPAFFTRATAFFDKAETSIEKDKSSAALAADIEKYKLSLEAADKQAVEMGAAALLNLSELTSAKAKIAELEKENSELKASAKTAEQIGSIKAAQITAAQGQPPLPISPEANPANPKGPELTGLARVTAALAKKQV